MSRMPPICGTGLASMDRMRTLRAVAEEVVVTARVVPGGIRATLRVRDSMSAAVADCFPMELNVHHAKDIRSGYPFLGSCFGVRLEEDLVPAHGDPRDETARTEPELVARERADRERGGISER